MSKRTVHFDASKAGIAPRVGCSAIVWPLDHSDSQNVSNTTSVITSQVVRVNDDGSFETLNSVYVPAKQ